MKILDKLQRRREGTSTLVGKFVQVASFHLRVDSVIGEGGFATIYQASETRSGQPFALKHFRFACVRDTVRAPIGVLAFHAKNRSRVIRASRPRVQRQASAREPRPRAVPSSVPPPAPPSSACRPSDQPQTTNARPPHLSAHPQRQP